MMEHDFVNKGLALERGPLKDLKAIAAQNDRSLSAEVRIAIRERVAKFVKQQDSEQTESA